MTEMSVSKDTVNMNIVFILLPPKELGVLKTHEQPYNKHWSDLIKQLLRYRRLGNDLILVFFLTSFILSGSILDV